MNVSNIFFCAFALAVLQPACAIKQRSASVGDLRHGQNLDPHGKRSKSEVASAGHELPMLRPDVASLLAQCRDQAPAHVVGFAAQYVLENKQWVPQVREFNHAKIFRIEFNK